MGGPEGPATMDGSVVAVAVPAVTPGVAASSTSVVATAVAAAAPIHRVMQQSVLTQLPRTHISSRPCTPTVLYKHVAWLQVPQWLWAAKSLSVGSTAIPNHDNWPDREIRGLFAFAQIPWSGVKHTNTIVVARVIRSGAIALHAGDSAAKDLAGTVNASV